MPELFWLDFFSFLVALQFAGIPRLGQASRIRKLPWSLPQLFSSKGKNDLLTRGRHPERPLLPDSFLKPVIETKILINQKTSHCSLYVSNFVPRMHFYKNLTRFNPILSKFSEVFFIDEKFFPLFPKSFPLSWIPPKCSP